MRTIILTICASILFCGQINAQGWLNKLGKTAEDATKKTIEKRVEKKAGDAANKTMDEIEGVGKNDSIKIKSQSDVKKAENNSNKNTGDGVPLSAYSKYDFVPGDKILFYEDFSRDAVGDFPEFWTTNKSGEINTLNIAPGNWLNLNALEGLWWFLKPIDFPKNFILEFDVVPKKGGGRYAVCVALYGEKVFNEMSNPYTGSTTALMVDVAKTGWESEGIKQGNPTIYGNTTLSVVEEEKVNHVIIWVQNRRVRIYHKNSKVLDIPTNLYEDSKFTRLAFHLSRGASSSSYIGNIKITTASPDTRNKLLTEGKLVTYGIYFDVNKDIVKPESYGTLKDIAKALNEAPDIKVKIIGHTDSDGDDSKNLDLSRRRAVSVKDELVKSFGINGERLTTDGMGETQPVAKNDLPINKALNRRVEFIKIK